MSENRFTPETAIAAGSSLSKLPETRQERPKLADTVEIRLSPLSPEDQQLASLPEDVSAEVFAKLAQKGHSAF